MDLVGDLDDLEPPKSGISPIIKSIYQSSRGRDICGNNGSIISDVFLRQSTKWPTIAETFVARAVGIVHEFIMAACRAVCHSEGICQKLTQVLEELVMPRYEAAFKQMRFILNIERFSDLQTLNQEYSKRYEHLRTFNAKFLLRQSSLNGHDVLEFDEVERHVSQMAQDSQPINDIAFKLDAYYSVAVLRFMDNVWNQAIEYFLVSSPESPLALFTQQWVMTLDQERLAQITAEPLMVREKRSDLERQIDDLNAALKVLRF
ncbi:hypothetical protein CFIMG_000379RA2 [Ceratocystis fimbriata CBS 114723]|uniref:GED domain-containing protein n=1 Tax=Ceratocystis fimbriata CBS 114723 TaxID=1035309 RepID=A0A2C5XMP0_9PEZI|nr:hypothetical protein CFIMG_000379RA2 [Ceratocystis fimbriata CBS 114723]